MGENARAAIPVKWLHLEKSNRTNNACNGETVSIKPQIKFDLWEYNKFQISLFFYSVDHTHKQILSPQTVCYFWHFECLLNAMCICALDDIVSRLVGWVLTKMKRNTFINHMELKESCHLSIDGTKCTFNQFYCGAFWLNGCRFFLSLGIASSSWSFLSTTISEKETQERERMRERKKSYGKEIVGIFKCKCHGCFEWLSRASER